MVTNSKTGLGKGFESLIPTDFDNSIVDGSERIQKIEINKVIPNPDQPRREFDKQALEELAESIKRYGILQPLVVTKKGDTYLIIAGERRWRASKIAKLDKVPVIVRSHEELEQLEIAIIENVQRVDLSPLEQAQSIQKLHNQFSMSYADIASRLGKAPTTVNNIVRLMQLPENAKQALKENKISEGHARAILALKGMEDQQTALLDRVVNYNWSVRQAEQYVNSIKEGNSSEQTVKKKMLTETIDTKKLSELLNTPISIRRTANGGKLEIHFSDDNKLDELIRKLTS
ncbi:MAG TPA: ParB/RepB/Spo0J family partition protein [Candidatus Saccharibacteria bacterium]|nr:ParB/RepB/Spo0J family partition protein [Candidatus Saccharibacteria bacterium]